jgi:hypothetical protein
MLARVSNLESFRQWKDDEDLGLGWLIERIFDSTPSPAMRAGTAFHKALELATCADFECLSADGYTFQFDCDAEIAISPVREIRGYKNYGDLTVTGQCDCIDGKVVIDYKTTANFDPDRYMFGYQWRFYLDIFEADLFRWNIFEIKESDDPFAYVVRNFHRLEQRRYPDMAGDCAKLAKEYADFYQTHLANVKPVTLEDQLRASLELTSKDIADVTQGAVR